MNSKRYFIGGIIFLMLFYAGNVFMYNDIKAEDTKFVDKHGDLCRMGKYSAVCRGDRYVWTRSQTPPKTYEGSHLILKKYLDDGRTDHVDILTIGDSFSNGIGGTFYQDYLNEISGKTIMNAYVIKEDGVYDALSMLQILDDQGVIDRIKPKVILLESGGRTIASSYDRPDIPLPQYTYEEFINKLSDERPYWDIPVNFDIKNPNTVAVTYRWLTDYISSIKYSMRNDDRLLEGIAMNVLDRHFFTSAGTEDKLLYIYQDLSYLDGLPNYEHVNNKFNQVAKEYALRGIKIIFMIPPDKFDLYYLYIVDKRGRMENPLIDQMDALPKEYTFINLKRPLRKELEKGVQDLYWHDDTHWSWKAIEVVCQDLLPHIQ